ncbi:MAG TPA: tetratricopeptide repeat protein [Candidatus Moranbacteria bacterium]|nr:tetratricopeptide repeat protein [Candidatus Moranbacteria bacterium]
MDNYKKWIVVAIIAGMAIIVVLAASTSKHKKESPAAEPSGLTSPSGPMLGPEPIKEASAFPDDPKQLADIGDNFFENQNFEQAIIVYEKALKLNPDDVDTYNDLGLAYLYTGRPEKAIKTIKKGTEINPIYQRIWLTQGYILLSLKKQEEGKQSLEKAFKLDSGSIIGKEAKRMLGLIKPN